MQSHVRIIVLSGVVLLVGVLLLMRQPRGIRNNNPGNIRHGASAWGGMSVVQTDPDFVQFDAPEYGIRALTVLLRNYQGKYGAYTLRDIIERYAPQSENNTESYVNAVASRLGVGADEYLPVNTVMPDLVAAIIRHENGEQPYDAELIQRGILLA